MYTNLYDIITLAEESYASFKKLENKCLKLEKELKVIKEYLNISVEKVPEHLIVKKSTEWSTRHETKTS